MYFVDREKIEQTLQYLEELVQLFESHSFETKLEKMALERIVQMIIESILDVGNSMIDGFIMRDPGSFEDIIDILEDETVIGKDDAIALKAVIQYRKMLVQHYLQVNHVEMGQEVKKHLGAITRYPQQVRSYLENELGPVSAFRR